MTVVTLKPEQLGGALVREAKKAGRAVNLATIRAARRFQSHLREETDAKGITDRGILKNSWRAEKTQSGAVVFSDAPYAGIIELGARPHKVGKRVRELLAAWAVRKLGLTPADAERAAFFIAKKIEDEGQAPKYLVRDALPMARAFYREEVTRLLRRAG